ncbi:MAG: hypothetical protein ISS52_02695 [Dehalococcoidia bacterium]|nr:hypothetical protein [Dehalococcoidia bacterium]
MDRCKQHTVLFLALALLLTSSIVACAKPAEFQVISLDVVPPEVAPGEAISVSAEVKNVGGSDGVYTAILTVDGVEVESEDVTVSPGASETVSFLLVKDEAGTYQVAVGESSSSFTVKQKLVAREIELKYDDGKARGLISAIPNGGYLIEFSPSGTPFTIRKVKMAGKLYAGKRHPVSLPDRQSQSGCGCT